jgi:LysM repeat protein
MKLFNGNKPKLNLSIDFIMLLLLIPVAGIGFLMKYVLISGIERNTIYGNNVDLEFFRLTRHQWGAVHLTLSFIFLILLFLHIILHWKLILSVFRQMVQIKAIRLSVTIFLALFCLIILFPPFFISPDQVLFEAKHRNRTNGENSELYQNSETFNSTNFPVRQSEKTEDAITTKDDQEINSINTDSDHHQTDYEEYEVNGTYTLQSISDKYNVPVSYMARNLNIPENMTGQKLGRLKRQYPFTMTDVRKSISDYKKR